MSRRALASIEVATVAHVQHIVKNVRQADVQELWASSYATPEQSMNLGIKHSDASHTGLINLEPVCMWGVVTSDLLSRRGVPWMVGTSKLDDHSVTFLRHCRKPLVELFENYAILENYVDQRNTKAIIWLKWMGFEIGDAEPHGVLQLPFHKFTMRR